MRYLILIFAFLSSAALMAFADQTDQGQQVFNLKDGSQIKGQLVSVQDGVYTVKTPIIGDIHIAASDVSSITNGDAAVPVAATSQPPATGADTNQQIASAQQKLLSNPQSMALIQEMAQDPQIAQALQDPALVQAVTNHDYQAVAGNPNAQALMSNPKMQELLHQLADQQKQQNASSQ
jgi:hypothetical protein